MNDTDGHSQDTNTQQSLLARQETVDRSELDKYLAPGAIDAFLAAANAIDDEVESNMETQTGGYEVPKELLVTMPIADVPPGTIIIPLNNQKQRKSEGIPPKPPAPPEPAPGTSGVQPAKPAQHQDVVHEDMEVETVTVPSESRLARETSAAKPKKGTNVKNRKKVTPTGNDETADEDTLPARMEMLKEIAEVIRNRTGPRRSEMELWGNYIGAKAERIPEGLVRDKVLLFVERNMNKAIHGERTDEE